MCVGGPPNPIHPSRPHSRRTVPADAWCIGAPAYGPTRRHRRARSPGGAGSYERRRFCLRVAGRGGRGGDVERAHIARFTTTDFWSV